MTNPLVSVIVPSYNCARYLPETLDSILVQTWSPVEIIVVDDGSTDDTQDVLKRYAGKIRVIRLDKNCGGPAKPRNVGIQNASGKYVALFDSDDIMTPDKLERQVKFLEAHHSTPFVFSNFRNFSVEGPAKDDFLRDHKDFQAMAKEKVEGDGFKIWKGTGFETLIEDNYIGTSGAVFRKDLAEKLGGFDETLSNSDDVDFFFRVTDRFEIGYIDAELHRRRVHAGNISSRSAALLARLKVREKLSRLPLSPRDRNAVNRSLAQILFSIGYNERVAGNRLSAIGYYWRSWNRDRSQILILKSMVRALLPF